MRNLNTRKGVMASRCEVCGYCPVTMWEAGQCRLTTYNGEYLIMCHLCRAEGKGVKSKENKKK